FQGGSLLANNRRHTPRHESISIRTEATPATCHQLRRKFKMRNKSITLVLMILLVTVLTACGGETATPTPVTTTAPTTGAEATATTATTGEATATTGEAAPTTGTGAGSTSGGKTYVLVPKNLGNPYFDTANKGAQEAAKELGVTVTYQGPSTADATQQIQLINSLIAQNVGGLAISADDSDALVTAGTAPMSANTPDVSWH